ncbi:hypothetical protein GCM10010307_58370 [Streptomyces vastus]|uniref:Uncharacterized protein n=1 Tax=Streptomyces vastus TaxID=285451 RepID=A0ABN3RF61_9ACTN
MDPGYKGKILRLSSDGKKDLKEWGCRDKQGRPVWFRAPFSRAHCCARTYCVARPATTYRSCRDCARRAPRTRAGAGRTW